MKNEEYLKIHQKEINVFYLSEKLMRPN